MLAEFCVLSGLFIFLAIAFLRLKGLRNLGWCSVPVLVTIQAIATFLVLPVWQFVTGTAELDQPYVHAMSLVLIGFISFWIGALAIRKKIRFHFVLSKRDTPRRVLFASTAMLILGCAGNLFLWKAGLLGYLQENEVRVTSQPILQWINFFANLLNATLIVSAIEVFGRQSTKRAMKGVLWISLLVSIGVGLLSGMKAGIILPLGYVAVIYSIIRKRFTRSVVLIPVVMVFLVYPFVGAYRDNINHGYRSNIYTLEGQVAALTESFRVAFLDRDQASNDAANNNAEAAISRSNYLAMVRITISVEDPSKLNGDEKVWLAPIYPFVPRFFWRNKPVLNKGRRLSIAIGSGTNNSVAVTQIGDLYLMYGTVGVAAGMLFYGILLQMYTNWIGGRLSERELFLYISVLYAIMDIGADVTGQVTEAIQTIAVTLFVAYMIYGRPEVTRSFQVTSTYKEWSKGPGCFWTRSNSYVGN